MTCFFGTFVKDLDLDLISLAKEFDLDRDFAVDFDRIAQVDFDIGCNITDGILSDSFGSSSPSAFNLPSPNSTLTTSESTIPG